MVCIFAIVFRLYHKQAVNAMSEELSNIAIEASVWDLEATCPYYKVFENLAASAKKTVPIVAMKCLKTQSRSFSFSSNSTRRQTMAFYLGTYTGCIGVVEITSFWSHTEGKTCPSRLHLRFSSKGPILKLKCMLKMWSRRLTRNLTYMINFMVRRGNGDFVMASGEPATRGTDEKHEFSVHALKTDHKEGEDTRVLPVHYSNNHFSLVLSKVMPIKITFKVPPGVTP